MNIVILTGRLGKDPEVKQLDDGLTITKFSFATSEYVKGEEQTEWHNVVTFAKTAENVGKYLKKGSAANITGRIQTRKYETEAGETKYFTEIVANRVEFGAKQSTADTAATTTDSGPEPQFDADEQVPFWRLKRFYFVY